MAIPPEGIHRDIGALTAEQRAMQEQLTDIKADVRALRSDMEHIKSFISETKGGRTYLWAALALAGGFGALITQLINVLKFWQ